MCNDWVGEDEAPDTSQYGMGTATTLEKAKRAEKSRCRYGFKFVQTDKPRRKSRRRK